MSAFFPNAEQAVGETVKDPRLNGKVKLLWIAMGEEDGLFNQAKQTEKVLQAHNIRHIYRVTEGGHTWPVWRKHLAEVAPLLFVE